MRPGLIGFHGRDALQSIDCLIQEVQGRAPGLFLSIRGHGIGEPDDFSVPDHRTEVLLLHRLPDDVRGLRFDGRWLVAVTPPEVGGRHHVPFDVPQPPQRQLPFGLQIGRGVEHRPGQREVLAGHELSSPSFDQPRVLVLDRPPEQQGLHVGRVEPEQGIVGRAGFRVPAGPESTESCDAAPLDRTQPLGAPVSYGAGGVPLDLRPEIFQALGIAGGSPVERLGQEVVGEREFRVLLESRPEVRLRLREPPVVQGEPALLELLLRGEIP